MSDTLLKLTGVGVPPYSARGLLQSLVHIAQASQARRTVNGALKDVSAAEFRKYRSVIAGSAQHDVPAVDGVWPGHQVTVDCIVELAQVAGTTEEPHVLGRTAVPESEREADGFVFYRPRLVMLVTEFSVDHDEWGAEVGWTMSLEEV